MSRPAWITLAAAMAVLVLPLSWAWLAVEAGDARLAPPGDHDGIVCTGTLVGEPAGACAVQVTPLLAAALLLAGAGATTAFLATGRPTRRVLVAAGGACALAFALVLLEAAMGAGDPYATLSRPRILSHTAVLGLASATLFIQGSRAP